MRRISIGLICAIMTAVLVGGCGGSEKPGPNTGNKSTGDDPLKNTDGEGKIVRPDVSKRTADFSLTAEEFFNEYKKDAKAAEAKYMEKVVELTGVVHDVGRHHSGDDARVGLAAGKFEQVLCYTAEKEPWAKVVPGQKVKLKGICLEYVITPWNCVFTEVGPFQGITLSAEQLAKEFEADPDATNEKYADKHLFLTGTVVDKKTSKTDSFASVFLMGTPKVAVDCGFHVLLRDEQEAFLSSFQKGQQIRLVGQYSRFSRDGNVQLYRCNQVKGQ